MRITIRTFLFLTIFIASGTSAADKYASQFIENMPNLTTSADDSSMLIWRKENVSSADYTKLMITQPYFYLSDNNKYKGMQPDQLKLLADAVVRLFVNRLGEVIEIVDEPGPGVLVANMALTEVRMKKKRSILGYSPLGALAHAATSQKKYEDLSKMAKKIQLTDANLEIEILDGATQERLSITILKIKGKEKGRDEDSWEALRKELDALAGRFYTNYTASLVASQ